MTSFLRPPIPPTARATVAAVVCLGLSACSSLQPNTAMELIQHQQEQQAMMRTAEAKAARRNMPSQADMMLNVVREARDNQRYFAVLAYARKYIADHGHSPELDAMYAEALMETGQLQESRALYQSLLSTPLAAKAHHGLGLLAARSHDDAGAARQLSQAVALQPANPTFLSDLGYARLRAGDLKQAGLALGQAAEIAPNDNRILGNMAILLLLRGQAGQADALMQSAAFPPSTRERVYTLAAELRARPVAAVPATATAVRGDEPGKSSAPHVTAVSNAPPLDASTALPVASLEHQRLMP